MIYSKKITAMNFKKNKFPQIFSRSHYCEKCYSRNVPYTTMKEIKHQKPLYFSVVKISETYKQKEIILELRKQSYPVERGYTPHVYYVFQDISDPSIDKESRFEVGISCGVEGCGVITYRDEFLRMKFDIDWDFVLEMKSSELAKIFHSNEDPHYRFLLLDRKEFQSHQAIDALDFIPN